MKNTVICGDCLNIIREMEDGTVDLILCDLPYGTTQNKWDSVIPLDLLWGQYRRVAKPDAAVVLTASQPFTSLLVSSQIKLFRHEWIWRKNNATGHLNAKRMPMKEHESVLVFGNSHIKYNPQGLRPFMKKTRRGHNGGNYGKSGRENFQEWTNYPRSILEFPSDEPRIYPTQKPVALFEYLIRTYSDPGAIVLDNCIGSGTTAVACKNTGRHFIGIDISEDCCKMTMDRIK
jgi:site-specific DNA-methyltransferase (adenine-specific)